MSKTGIEGVEQRRKGRKVAESAELLAAAPVAASTDAEDAALELAADLSDQLDSVLLAVAAAESRLRHQAADYERRIADLTRQCAAAEIRAREAREMADRVLVGAMLGASQAAKVLAEHGVRSES